MSQMHSVGTVPEWDLIDRLHKSLRQAGLSATSMSVQLGMHRNTVNNYLSGKTDPDRRTLIAWAMATGVPLAWLLTGNAESPRPGEGPDGGLDVRREGIEPPTRWFGVSPSQTASIHDLDEYRRAA